MCIRDSRTSDIITVSERADEIMNVLNGNYDHGYDVGYGPLTDRVFHPTDQGGLIIATGKPNSGKTDFLNDLTCRLMAKTGRNVCYLSFEAVCLLYTSLLFLEPKHSCRIRI